MCSLLGVSRSGWYASWRSRPPALATQPGRCASGAGFQFLNLYDFKSSAMHSFRIGLEEELLTFYARLSGDGFVEGRIENALQRGVDWSRFLQAAVHHRVVPLAGRAITARLGDSIPERVEKELAARSLAIARRNLYLTARLSHLASQLEAEGVRVIAYKGPVSAALVYGNLSLRQFGDLDILVDEREYVRTCALLQMLGYRMSKDWGWECSFDNEAQSVRVDLHRNVVPDQFSVRLDFNGLWQRRQCVPIAGGNVQTLSLEDTLIVLCIQLAKDAWGESALRLSKVCDIAEMLRGRSDIDWSRLMAQANDLGCRRIVEVSLSVAERLLGPLTIKNGVIGTFGARHDSLEEHVVARMFGTCNGETARQMSRSRFQFTIRERWRDKAYPYALACILLTIPNERDRSMVSLPESVSFLYYLVRPIRLLRDQLRGLVGRRE